MGLIDVSLPLQLVLVTYSFQLRTILAFVASILAWFGFVLAYSSAFALTGLSSVRDFAYEGYNVLSNPAFWLTVPVCVTLPLLLDFTVSRGRRYWWPKLLDVVQEWDRYGGKLLVLPLFEALCVGNPPSSSAASGGSSV